MADRSTPALGKKGSAQETLTWQNVGQGKLCLTSRPRLRRIPCLREEGCTWVVSLLGRKEEPHSIGEAVRREGMGWRWVELSHGRPPEGRERAALWRQVRALAALLAESHRVLLHCSAGQHRTGMVAYMLLRSLGIEQGEALERISALRPATRAGLEQDRTRLVEPGVGW